MPLINDGWMNCRHKYSTKVGLKSPFKYIIKKGIVGVEPENIPQTY